MARVKRGVTAHAKHKKTLDAAKGFQGRRKNTIRAAKAAVDKAMQYSYRDRKNKKRNVKCKNLFVCHFVRKVKHSVYVRDDWTNLGHCAHVTVPSCDARSGEDLCANVVR